MAKKLNKQEKQLFDEVKLAMKYGNNDFMRARASMGSTKSCPTMRFVSGYGTTATLICRYNNENYVVNFCYSKNLFERAATAILNLLKPTKNYVEVEKYHRVKQNPEDCNGFRETDMTAKFTGLQKRILMLKAHHYANKCSR